MDAEARTSSRVLAAVPPLGASYAYIAARSGLRGEALDSALRDLVRTRVLTEHIVGRSKWFRNPALVPPKQPQAEFPPPARPERGGISRVQWLAERDAEARKAYALAQQGLTQREIGAQMGVSHTVICRRLRRARGLLREGRL